jgi:hypothetical protein
MNFFEEVPARDIFIQGIDSSLNIIFIAGLDDASDTPVSTKSKSSLKES